MFTARVSLRVAVYRVVSQLDQIKTHLLQQHAGTSTSTSTTTVVTVTTKIKAILLILHLTNRMILSLDQQELFN
jgi:hypothetical protein